MKFRPMTGKQFLAIRTRLGLSQGKLGALLGYKSGQMISAFEGDRREIPPHLALLMEAVDNGFWSKKWPKVDQAEAA